MALAKTPPDWTNPRSESFADLFLKSKTKAIGPSFFYSISFKIKFFNALFKFLLNCSGCTCTSWKPLPVEGLKRPGSHATRRYIFGRNSASYFRFYLFYSGKTSSAASRHIWKRKSPHLPEDLGPPSSHFHLHISTWFAVFFLTAQLWSRQKAISAISLQQRFPEHRDCCSMIHITIYDIPPYYIYVYIDIRFRLWRVPPFLVGYLSGFPLWLPRASRVAFWFFRSLHLTGPTAYQFQVRG